MAKWLTYAATTAIGALAALATILQYVETSQKLPKWVGILTSIPPQVLLGIVGFAVLTVLGFGAKRLTRLEDRVSDNRKRLDGVVQHLADPTDGLVRAQVRLGLHEQRLDNLAASLLDGLAADVAPDRRRFAFQLIDGLSDIQRHALFQRHPEVVEWYAEIEDAATGQEGIDRGEVVFREPDGRAWAFGEICDLSGEEQDALRDEKPRVWRAYRGRLFRDVVFPARRGR